MQDASFTLLTGTHPTLLLGSVKLKVREERVEVQHMPFTFELTDNEANFSRIAFRATSKICIQYNS